MAIDAKSKAIFKRLKYEDYSKLSPEARDHYNKQEREANFDRKMRRKGYGVQSNKLSKFFGNMK